MLKWDDIPHARTQYTERLKVTFSMRHGRHLSPQSFPWQNGGSMTYFCAKFIKMSERTIHTLVEDTNDDSNYGSLCNLQAVIVSKPMPDMKLPPKRDGDRAICQQEWSYTSILTRSLALYFMEVTLNSEKELNVFGWRQLLKVLKRNQCLKNNGEAKCLGIFRSPK